MVVPTHTWCQDGGGNDGLTRMIRGETREGHDGDQERPSHRQAKQNLNNQSTDEAPGEHRSQNRNENTTETEEERERERKKINAKGGDIKVFTSTPLPQPTISSQHL